MCGFAGILSKSDAIDTGACKAMTDTLAHRGPDDSGVWQDLDHGIALGHRRLSIQDLSAMGHQPMLSASGRYVIVYNGEIYNFRAIQKELQEFNCVLRGHSDTEVLLAAIESWGLEQALTRFAGMFAFALWDKHERTLTMARDRIGEKPLYFGWQGKSLLFASELKALRTHPDWVGEIDRNSLALLMRYNYIPAPYSIYCDIHKLMPGTYVHFRLDTPVGQIPSHTTYWSAIEVMEQGISHSFAYSDDEAIDALEKLLGDTIQEKMIADVPLGAFLSGGIDSSAVVAIMQSRSLQKVKTFSIGFHEEDYNEAQHAKEVARHLGTDHTELYVTPEQAMEVIPKLAHLYDEPFSDSSQIPTFLVSGMTKKHVTVALSGDGGDELFGGYNRYFLGMTIWNKLSRIPHPFRALAAKSIIALRPQTWDRIGKYAGFMVPQMKERAGDKLHKLAEILAVGSADQLYDNLVSHWKSPSSLVHGSREPLTALTDPDRQANIDDFSVRMMFLDMVSYLPDDILVKVDRAAMGVSLETRVPFLDHRVVEFASRLPVNQKIRNGQGKWLLRQVLYKYVPETMLDRPKMGFGIPIDVWLRGPLRDWAEALLDERRLANEGYFNVEMVRNKWREHLSGKRNWQYYLWDVLMFQDWKESVNRH